EFSFQRFMQRYKFLFPIQHPKEEVLKHIYDPNAIYILFLDEITAAPTSLQAAAYQLTLDRRVGDHILPDNTIIIAAGNRASDKGSFFKMPA
ncbi:hypothetical protein U2102_14740, partial [Listeria monocytogenes]